MITKFNDFIIKSPNCLKMIEMCFDCIINLTKSLFNLIKCENRY